MFLTQLDFFLDNRVSDFGGWNISFISMS